MNINSKLEELLAAAKLNDIIRVTKKQEPEPVSEKKNTLVIILAVVGAIAAVAAIAYAVYRFVTPDYLDDFDNDFDDEFEDDEEEEKEEKGADTDEAAADEPAADAAPEA